MFGHSFISKYFPSTCHLLGPVGGSNDKSDEVLTFKHESLLSTGISVYIYVLYLQECLEGSVACTALTPL